MNCYPGFRLNHVFYKCEHQKCQLFTNQVFFKKISRVKRVVWTRRTMAGRMSAGPLDRLIKMGLIPLKGPSLGLYKA